MTVEEARSMLRNDPSPEGIGRSLIAIGKAGGLDAEFSDMKELMAFAGEMLVERKTQWDRIQEVVNDISTVEEMKQFIWDVNYGHFNEMGIPISRMIAVRMCELYGNQDHSCGRGLLRWILGFFKGKDKKENGNG